ncbi:MAG: Transcriptional regulator, GntR family [Gemmatimonadetes bacterium]|jgi:GntR family transcriptional regulator|nr:Transcriptional regulator, GntR family [Gemmatimonadota bacterium]
MHIVLDPGDPQPLYLQIVDEVRRALVRRTLVAGDSLPSVRQLAAELRLNPNTVSQAYQELERQGLVEVRRGHGTFATGGGASDRDRRMLARDVAARAIRDAHRNGVEVDELVEAIRLAVKSHVQREAR